MNWEIDIMQQCREADIIDFFQFKNGKFCIWRSNMQKLIMTKVSIWGLLETISLNGKNMGISPRIIPHLYSYLIFTLKLDLWFANISSYKKATKESQKFRTQARYTEVLLFSLHNVYRGCITGTSTTATIKLLEMKQV